MSFNKYHINYIYKKPDNISSREERRKEIFKILKNDPELLNEVIIKLRYKKLNKIFK